MYTLIFISIFDGQTSPDIVHVVTWTVSLVSELIITAASFTLFSGLHNELKAFDSHPYLQPHSPVALLLPLCPAEASECAIEWQKPSEWLS